MIKITDDDATRLGISSLADIEAALNERKNLKTQTASDNAKLNAFDARISALEAKANTAPNVDVDAIVAKAVAQADVNANAISAKAVSAAIARAGQSGLAPNKPENEGNETKPQPAADDYKGQWDASENIRSEFISFKSYEAFKRAEAKGQIKQREARK